MTYTTEIGRDRIDFPWFLVFCEAVFLRYYTNHSWQAGFLKTMGV